MTVAEMLKTHPKPVSDEAARAIAALSECAEICTVCADACLAEPDFQQLRRCIELNEVCADICEAAASVVTRAGTQFREIVKPLLEACVAACSFCAEECEKHAGRHEHCRVCAESCRKCEATCRELLGT